MNFTIVGAGFAGLTLAQKLCEIGHRCLVVDKRPHIGGNCYDKHDDHGVLLHEYGPHYFRTNSKKVLDYLSRFTEWLPVDYKIKSFAEGRLWSFPINLNTYEELIGRPSTTEEFEEYLARVRVPIENPKNSEEVIVSQVGWQLYETFFLGYTLKQWKKHPRDLDASVCGRIPIRTNRDDRYLKEDFQAIPTAGYTKLFENMVASCGDNIRIMLNADFKSVKEPHDYLIYTGPIDEYFGKCYGALPYRSLRFEREHHAVEFYQPAMQVNYPNDYDYTRIVEIKHATGQKIDHTTIVKEYPSDEGDPYYPIPNDETAALYKKYQVLADSENRVSFVGRLARYRYYNMDQIVAMALSEFEYLQEKKLV